MATLTKTATIRLRKQRTRAFADLNCFPYNANLEKARSAGSVSPVMIKAPINVFQRLARQWDAMHPYNAAQVLKIEGTPSPSALQEAWHDALNDLGLGRVHVNGRGFYFECLNGEMSLYGVRVVPAGTSLEDYISEQLNRRFDNPAEPPFRPFVLRVDGYYYAGVIYHHWVADSVSIRTVLREWFVRLFDPKNSIHRPVQLADNSYRRFFSLLRSGTAMGQGLLTATRWASSAWRAVASSGGFIARARRGEVSWRLPLSYRWPTWFAPVAPR